MIKKCTPDTAEKIQSALNGLIMCRHPRAELILLQLESGEKIEEHTNPFDVIFVGMEGEVKLLSGAHETDVAALQTAYIPAGMPRAIHNNINASSRLMVIKLL